MWRKRAPLPFDASRPCLLVDGHEHLISWRVALTRHGGPQPSRHEEALLIEWLEHAPEPTRYWLIRTGLEMSLNKLVATAQARGRIEQDYNELEGGTRPRPL